MKICKLFFVLATCLCCIHSGSAGFLKKLKREVKRVLEQGENVVRKAKRHVDGTSDCKHNCQCSKDFNQCFQQCKNGKGFAFMTPEVKIQL
jgi:hypothetical protein